MKAKLTIGLRAKFILYLVCVHLLFAGVAVYLLTTNRVWLLAVEAVFIISLYAGLRLIRQLFNSIELINTGAQFIQDSDFTSRFSEVGQRELDHLIQVYNRMADHLREERTRMQEQNYFLDRLLTASPSGIITLDFDGRVTTVNPAAERMFQQPPASLIGGRLSELKTPFTTALDALKPGESQILPLNGPMLGRHRVKCQKSQFLDRGFAREFILIEELTEELRAVEKTAYEKVIRVMSHEVNNSVGSANSLLHSLLHYSGQLRGEDREDFETALGVVIGRTDHLNGFMRNFADVFRLPPPSLQPCDPVKLVEDVAFLFKAECARRRITLEFEIETRPDPVGMDRGQMEQVFVNVLKNSIEAIGEDGRVTVRIGRKARRNFIVIEDTGGGISPAAQANLFTPFFSTKGDGQGIGLTLAQEVLVQHNFEFSLDSQPGGPTLFTFWF